MVRGGTIRNRPNIRGMRTAFKKVFVPRHPFDQTLAEIMFPKVNNVTHDDSALTAVSFIFSHASQNGRKLLTFLVYLYIVGIAKT